MGKVWLAIWCAIAFFAAAPADAQTKLTVGQASLSASGWPGFVADDQGYFAKAGVAPDTAYIGNVASVAQQVVGGSLDLGYTTFEVAVQAIQAGAPIVLIGSTLIKYPYSLMSTRDIKTAADLKGKKVILPIAHADVANFFEMWMDENHISKTDVDRVYDGSSTNRYAALVAGVVSAAALNSPLDFAAAKSGYSKLLDFGKYVKNYGFVGIVARRDWASAHRKTVEAYLLAMSRGTDWLYDPANRDHAIQILMRVTKQNKTIAEQTYEYYIRSLQPFSPKLDIPDADLTNVVHTLSKTGAIAATAANEPKSKFVDLSYLPK